ncbi:hypothetical protein IPJ72_01540 [Candidatus Peregrinibacteria bacterium]|nr:MAG: hypothetical protein IPJ72_01540 [Candidatus Peregrinibacteria bacterium]
MAVADAFDAMTAHRSYVQDNSTKRAVAELLRCSNQAYNESDTAGAKFGPKNQFDPEVVNAFLALKLTPVFYEKPGTGDLNF